MITQGTTTQSISACQRCGRHGPTKQATLHYNIGLIVLRHSATLQGTFCENCLSYYFWKYTLITLVFGWWGVISFFMTPLILVNNLRQFRAARLAANTQIDPLLSSGSIYPGERTSPSPQSAATGLSRIPWVSLINSGLMLLLAGFLTLVYIVQSVTSLQEWAIVIVLFGIVLFRVGNVALRLVNRPQR